MASELRRDFAAEVAELDLLLPGVAARWGYDEPGATPQHGQATGDPVG
jgi:hypothetical protein